ncbi:hypothetical protein [Flavisolibacter nicotianae]|uniref:hypothetical protein n=1 Tax=Flavisolibacter nicotianae TaxID=2364882 RepID=UPI0013C45053|nr:hypothetical protein [Flavisolibacter nicotianae]
MPYSDKKRSCLYISQLVNKLLTEYLMVINVGGTERSDYRGCIHGDDLTLKGWWIRR